MDATPSARPRGPRDRAWYLERHSGRPAPQTVRASRSPPSFEDTASRGPHPMSTARPTLAAEHREITGKAVARLRRAGRLPAVVYGHGVDSANLSVDTHDFELLRRQHRPERAGRPVGRRQEGQAGPHPGRPGPPGRPPHRPRRPLPGPDDRRDDRRRPARAGRHVAGDRRRRRHAPAHDRDRPGPGPAGPPAAVDRVLDREPGRLRRCDLRPRPVRPGRRHAADRRRRGRRQGPGAARRGSRRPGRDRRGRRRGAGRRGRVDATPAPRSDEG